MAKAAIMADAEKSVRELVKQTVVSELEEMREQIEGLRKAIEVLSVTEGAVDAPAIHDRLDGMLEYVDAVKQVNDDRWAQIEKVRNKFSKYL